MSRNPLRVRKSSRAYYYEAAHQPWRPAHDRLPVVEAPTALPIFPAELTKPSRRWAQRYYNLQRMTAMEEPAALAEDIRGFFRGLR